MRPSRRRRISTKNGIDSTLKKVYVQSGLVLAAFRNFPLRGHPLAFKAAEAAECAGEQGQFWGMHDRFFSDQAHLDDSMLLRHATDLNLDVRRWQSCRATEARSLVQRDLEEAQALNIPSTPVFLVGTTQADGRLKVQSVLRGARPAEEFRAALDKALLGSRR